MFLINNVVIVRIYLSNKYLLSLIIWNILFLLLYKYKEIISGVVIFSKL